MVKKVYSLIFNPFTPTTSNNPKNSNYVNLTANTKYNNCLSKLKVEKP